MKYHNDQLMTWLIKCCRYLVLWNNYHILLVLLISIHDTVLTTTTPTAAYAANSFGNGTAPSTQRRDELRLDASTVIMLQLLDAVLQEFSVASGSHPHDVAPTNGSVWYILLKDQVR
jgi:hypothetical protein